MSTIFRTPTVNRLQRFLTTRTPTRSSPSSPLRLRLPPRQTTSSPFFSTSRAVRNKTNTSTSTNTNTNTNTNTKHTNTNSSTSGGDTNAQGNPSYPKFDLRSIVPDPRARKVVIACFVVLVAAEAHMWVTYWPKIMGWWQGGEDGTRGEGEGSA